MTVSRHGLLSTQSLAVSPHLSYKESYSQFRFCSLTLFLEPWVWLHAEAPGRGPARGYLDEVLEDSQRPNSRFYKTQIEHCFTDETATFNPIASLVVMLISWCLLLPPVYIFLKYSQMSTLSSQEFAGP